MSAGYVRVVLHTWLINGRIRHQTTVMIYGGDGRPLKEVVVAGHCDDEPKIIERP